MSELTIVNFSHPLTSAQIGQIEGMLERGIDQVLEVPVDFSQQDSFDDQVQALLDSVDVAWETDLLLVNLPALSSIAAVTLARLHGLMGHFPTIVRIRPVAGSLLHEFEVAEIINLNDLRIRSAAMRKAGGSR